MRDTMRIEMGDRSATAHKAVVGIRDRYKVDVEVAPEQDDALILAITVCTDSMSRE